MNTKAVSGCMVSGCPDRPMEQHRRVYSSTHNARLQQHCCTVSERFLYSPPHITLWVVPVDVVLLCIASIAVAFIINRALTRVHEIGRSACMHCKRFYMYAKNFATITHTKAMPTARSECSVCPNTHNRTNSGYSTLDIAQHFGRLDVDKNLCAKSFHSLRLLVAHSLHAPNTHALVFRTHMYMYIVYVWLFGSFGWHVGRGCVNMHTVLCTWLMVDWWYDGAHTGIYSIARVYELSLRNLCILYSDGAQTANKSIMLNEFSVSRIIFFKKFASLVN